MNNYSWNLGPDDYIEHAATGKAHYSKNWDKAKQDAYKKAYYIKNKNRILARKQQLRAKQAGKELNYISNQASRIARDTANEINDAVNRDYAVTKFRNGVNDRIDAARDTAENLSNRVNSGVNRARSNARNNIDLARSRVNSGINSARRTANRVRSNAENEFNDIQRTARRTVNRTKSNVRNNVDLTRSRVNSGINSARRKVNSGINSARRNVNNAR